MEYVCFEVNLHHVEEIEGKFGIKVNFESFLKYEDNVTMKQLIKSKLNFIERNLISLIVLKEPREKSF